MNNTQKRTLRRIIIEAALLLLLLPLQARAAEYKCTAELPVEVRTSGAATAERFTITLTPEDGAPAPAADTVQVKGSGTASFTGLTYTAPGDYRYTVRQCAGGTAHMTYDATYCTPFSSSSSFRTTFARWTTLSGRPASLATSMP